MTGKLSAYVETKGEVRKMEALHEGALRTIEEVFGDRLKRRQSREASAGGALASVFPVSAEEVEILARLAQRHSVPLVALGAETAIETRSEEGSILVRFDLMRNLRLPESDESWAEAEPGALWLALDNDLRARGRGLTVYPTSAPRATIGGWVAQDGLGVGSFEYGWLRENAVPFRGRSCARSWGRRWEGSSSAPHSGPDLQRTTYLTPSPSETRRN